MKQGKGNRVFSRECTSHSKYPLPTTQEMTLHMDITSQYQNQIDYILCCQRWRSSIQSAKTRTGADCGSDNKLLIAKIRFKKVGKTTRPFRYDRNQIPYDYTAEETHIQGIRFNRVPEEPRTEVRDIVHEARIKTIPKIPKKKKCKKGKMGVWGGLTNGWEKKRSKR